MRKYDIEGLTFNRIELADDVGYSGWYSDSLGYLMGIRLYDGSFLEAGLCPHCRGREGNPCCESCKGTGSVEVITRVPPSDDEEHTPK